VRDLDLSKVVVKEALGVRETGTVIARGGDVPLVLAHQPDAAHTHIVVAFDPQGSNWPARVSFPVFVNSALELLAGRSSTATTQPTVRGVRQSFRPTSTGSGNTSWSSPIRDRAAGDGKAFMLVTAYRGDRWPVATRAGGEPVFYATLRAGDENQVLLDINEAGGKNSYHQLLSLNQPATLDIAGRPFVLTYCETTVNGTEDQYAEHATITVGFTSEDMVQKGAVHQRTSGTSRRTAVMTTTTPTTSSKNP
jgi:hypothetical protein